MYIVRNFKYKKNTYCVFFIFIVKVFIKIDRIGEKVIAPMIVPNPIVYGILKRNVNNVMTIIHMISTACLVFVKLF